jgi:hypothetical protein
MYGQDDLYALDLRLGGIERPFIDDGPNYTSVDLLPEPPEDDLLPARYNPPLIPWPVKLPIDLALGGEPTEDTLARFEVTQSDYDRWLAMPAFRKALSDASKEIRENGVTFKRLCGRIAEDYLGELDTALHDPKVGLALKLSAFNTITKLAGLDPKDEKTDSSKNNNLVNIQINL